MTKAMSLLITSLKEVTMSRARRPFSPAAIIEPPKNRAMTMTWSMFALLKAVHMLEGKMFTIVDMKPS